MKRGPLMVSMKKMGKNGFSIERRHPVGIFLSRRAAECPLSRRSMKRRPPEGVL